MKTQVQLTHPDRQMFPEGIAKRDVAAYYESVAEYMLPFLKDRPLVMQRFPEGIGKDGFYQKNASDYFPDWIRQAEVPKHGGTVNHVLCDDLDTLIYLVNQGTITFHVWTSRIDALHNPDVMVFDLDPHKDDAPEAVREGALELRALLEELGLRSFVQTSGSRGFHIDVPLARSEDFEAVAGFSLGVAKALVARNRKRYTTEFHKSKRGGRIFIDTLRNAYAQTAVAPYSLRPRTGAPAATPLRWEELAEKAIKPTDFGLATMGQRLKEHGDAWKGFFESAQPLKPAMELLDRLPT